MNRISALIIKEGPWSSLLLSYIGGHKKSVTWKRSLT